MLRIPSLIQTLKSTPPSALLKQCMINGRFGPEFLQSTHRNGHQHQIMRSVTKRKFSLTRWLKQEVEEEQKEDHRTPEIEHYRLMKLRKAGPNEPIYNEKYLSAVKKTSHTPKKLHQRAAYYTVKLMRTSFDIASRYKGPGGRMTKVDWLLRCVFLETLAGVPGMVAGMSRHLKSLRRLRNDPWIHTLLEEAENERMHLLIFMEILRPNLFFHLFVIGGQAFFFTWFIINYIISAKSCHRFVGYLEEEAVKTYTGMLEDLSPNGHLSIWGAQPAPDIATRYYKLPTGKQTIYDMIACIRADEANHRDVNHTIAAEHVRFKY